MYKLWDELANDRRIFILTGRVRFKCTEHEEAVRAVRTSMLSRKVQTGRPLPCNSHLGAQCTADLYQCVAIHTIHDLYIPSWRLARALCRCVDNGTQASPIPLLHILKNVLA